MYAINWEIGNYEQAMFINEYVNKGAIKVVANDSTWFDRNGVPTHEVFIISGAMAGIFQTLYEEKFYKAKWEQKRRELGIGA